MDSGIICACCGYSISAETLPECGYCGYINVGMLEDASLCTDNGGPNWLDKWKKKYRKRQPAKQGEAQMISYKENAAEILAQFGIAFKTKEETAAFASIIEEELDVRIGHAVGRTVTNEQMRELNRIDNLDQAKAWLDMHSPNYREIVQDVLIQSEAELKAYRDKIPGAITTPLEPKDFDAVCYRKEILKKLTAISVVTYQYKWDEKAMEYRPQSCEDIWIADGPECDGCIVWANQEFAQNPDSAEPLVLEIKYRYDGEERHIQYPIKPVRGEDFWDIGVEVNAQLKMVFHLGDKKHIARGGEIAFVNPQLQEPAEFFYWGPRRPLYSREQILNKPVFNSIVDHLEAGDERFFVRIAEKKGDGSRDYQSDIELEAGKQYEVCIAFRNDANQAYNEKELDYQGATLNTRLSTSFPAALAKGEQGLIKGTFISLNTVPATIWAGAYVTAKEPVKVDFVTGSAKIHNQWTADNSVLPANLLTDQGTFIGLNKLDGVIPGGDLYAGYVTYAIQTKAAT